jgi:hypothetical protein
MSDAERHVRNVIEGYLRETGWSASRLAREAELRPTTITRFLNNPDFKAVPGTTTLMKLQSAVAAWRLANDGAKNSPVATGVEHVGEFVQDADELAWLRVWRSMLPIDRNRAILVLRALGADATKFG